MRKLPFITGLLLIVLNNFAQSPHGDKLKMDCADCHTTGSWTYSTDSARFNHDRQTQFILEGQHRDAGCINCHKTLIFSDAQTSCVSCHTDMHNTTVGPDCARCHDANSWIVENITEIHQQSRFPLLGAHNTADCADCHKSASRLEFEPLGIGCIDCHRQNYHETTTPNHQQAGFSENCFECHNVNAFEWTSSGFNHNFFPLTKGHELNDCASCHGNNILNPLSSECFNCHQSDYNSATNPKHQSTVFSNSCEECHTTEPDWNPAKFEIHDQKFFPIYSGRHGGEWDKCTDCHTNPENYGVFKCTDCHEHEVSKMNNEHKGISGYSSDSYACFACHPQGNEEGAFNHNNTDFPLTGAHVTQGCLECHTNGFSGTSTLCNSCHTNDFNQAANPKHSEAGISVECEICHNTNIWKPSLFNHTGTGFELTGGHAGRQCSECHQGTTAGASPECYGCHRQNYEQAENHLSQGYPQQCLQCHTTATWDNAAFDHNTTGFPLAGAHAATGCAECHSSGYAGTPKDCASCHTDNYNASSNPGHLAAGISKTCETCHTPTGWSPSSFSHTTTGFELSGGHAGRQCSECHQGTTAGASPECYGCHRQNYEQAENHLSQGYPQQCLQCHTTATWDNAAFDHNTTGFPLAGAHAATGCAECHSAGYAGTPKDCASCHTDNYNASSNPGHLAAGISKTCETCHTPTGWSPSSFSHTTTGFELSGGHAGRQCSECHQGTTAGASPECYGCHRQNYEQAENHLAQGYPQQCLQCHTTATWDNAAFDHNATGFPLAGAHAATGCAECHSSGYAGTPKDCASCHTDNYNASSNPGHLAAGISKTCETCHTPAGWSPSSFSHTTTGFELSGGHAGRQCSECHQGTTAGASPECYGCHRQNYEQAENHLAQGYPQQCLQCHTTATWDNAAFDHNATGFPLAGAHAATGCIECHTAGYAGTPKDCASCHTDNYNASSNPGHLAAGISKTCETCHTPTGWSPSSFSHATTGFELSGGHAGRQCSECHQGTTAGASPECYGCHRQNYEQAENHLAQGYPQQCLQCHTTATWDNAAFDHNATGFPLAGAHAATGCIECHTAGYAGTPKDCASCHTDNYNASSNPGHLAAGISKTCETCHTPTGWSPSSFSHATTGFELSGGHAGRQCSECHQGTTAGASPECYGCHRQNYEQAENHLSQGYPQQCLQCHTTATWDNAAFDHNATGFPLAGAHAATGCAECHSSGYAGTPKDCASCHTDNYNASSNPGHLAAGISKTCETCHTPAGWSPSSFSHTTTGFELSGGHAGRQCSECHQGTTAGASPECYGCHRQNYEQAENHLAQGYPQQCLQCHTTATWDNAAFDHNATGFPLAGAHAATGCAECHSSGYAGTPKDCASCHTDNYNASSNPGHLAAGISKTCETCHTPTGWSPSSFSHSTTGFELSGGHAGRQCSECHQGTTAGASPECYGCHRQNYEQAENHLAQGYPQQCLQCHTTATWDNAAFDHNATGFPLAGAHAATGCIECHTAGYAGTPKDCASCHTDNYNASSNPGHLAAGISKTCETCHTPTGWSPSSFSHATTGFELSGGHAGRQCSECHQGTTAGASPECYGCHRQNYEQAENHLAQGYPQQCLQCHTTATWDNASFDHNATGFPLAGAHAATGCIECHTAGYAGTPKDCASCHTDNYNASSNPGHLAAGISKTCETCHTPTGWSPSSFSHATTGFELSGGHAGRQCSECHQGTTAGASPECYGCHRQNYEQAENHLAQGYPQQCLQCHTTATWDNAAFDHNATGFPLAGAHAATGCIECHTAGYAGTPKDCASCHTDNYNASSNPGHLAAGISKTCETCHTPTGWSPSSFSHATTGFELSGGHAGRQCSDCHQGTTAGASPECYGCHRQNYEQAENHLAQGYPQQCLQCHTTATWDNAAFDHNATGFPLAGAHAATGCVECHSSGYAGTPKDCASCHTDNYNTSSNPGHLAAGISKTCETCHTPAGWSPSSFSHTTTGFELSGGHAGRQCSECHQGTTTGANSDCYSCHQINYNQTVNPNHLNLGLSTGCQLCHTTNPDWEPATFSVHNNYYALNGAHATVANDCYLCHAGNYTNTPNTCYGCHSADYNNATDPNHKTAQFPTDCQSCHTETAWSPSTFNHDSQYFPIYSGKHQGEWTSCIECHTVPTNYSLFSCIDCHEHNNRTELANDHDEVNGYSYTSTACYSCHPQGRED